MSSDWEADRLQRVWKALDGPHGDNATLFENTKRLFDAAKLPAPDKFAARLMLRALERCEALGFPNPRYDIGLYMIGAAAQLLADERLDKLPPNPADYGYHGDSAILGQLRDILLQLQQKLVDPQRTLSILADTIADAFVAVIKRLPPIAHEDPAGDRDPDTVPTIPFIDVLPDIEDIIGAAIEPFQSRQPEELGLFRSLRATLQANLGTAEAADDDREFVHAVLKNTPLEEVFTGPRVPFSLPEETRFAGHWIIAPPGRGKTTLLHSMVKADLDKDASIILIDSKGDLIRPFKNLRSVKDRLILIEPQADNAFALNPLDVSCATVTQAVSLIEYVMAGLLDAKFTALQSTLFRNVVPAIIEAIPNPTIDDFKQVMVKGLPNLSNINPYARRFFEDQETGFYSKTYESTRKEIVWRLDYLMSNPILRSMFSASHTRLDIGKEMDAGRLIVINNSKAILGDEGAEFFGRFFIALIARAAQQRAGRSPSSKKPCYVYVDECQSVIAKDTRIPVLLDECRSQKVALILAHQRTAQLTAPVLDAVANCAIRMANSDDEAKFLADKLRMTADQLRSLPRGTFSVFVRDLTPKGIQLKVPKSDIDTMPQMTGDELSAVREQMRSAFSSLEPAPIDLSPRPAPEPQQAMPSPPAKTDPGEPAETW